MTRCIEVLKIASLQDRLAAIFCSVVMNIRHAINESRSSVISNIGIMVFSEFKIPQRRSG